MERLEYTDEIRDRVIELYNLGVTRGSLISCQLNHSITPEKVKEILMDYKCTTYQSQTIKGISFKQILDEYRVNEKNVLEILCLYPELSFGEIKKVIEGYYFMLCEKKPRNIPFPTNLVKEYLKNHNIAETCEEFGYEKESIIKRLSEQRRIQKMSKEELFAYRMEILEKDVDGVEKGRYPLKKFKKKYHGYNPSQLQPLIEEYKKQNG